jgi:Glyoxalase-like domain
MTQDDGTSRLVELCFDANEPLRLGRFWAEALRWEIDDDTSDEVGLVPTDGTSFSIRGECRTASTTDDQPPGGR